MKETAQRGPADERPTRDDAQFEREVLGFIATSLLGEAGADIAPDTYLFGDGLINSLRILDLVAFVDRARGIAIRDLDVTMEHFRTVRAIVRFFGPHSNELTEGAER